MPSDEEARRSRASASCTCEVCKKKKGLPNRVASRVIHEYSSTPAGGWRARRTAEETHKGITAPTFGVELETDAPSEEYIRDLPGRPAVHYPGFDATPEETALFHAETAAYTEWNVRNNAHHEAERARLAALGNITADEAVSLAAPRGMWHAKHDGSVSGPEFASQPATLAYWRASRPHLTAMFRTLLHGGMRSHDGDHCGLHINIGTDAFYAPGDYSVNIGHMRRFLDLIAVKPEWTIRVSQRTHSSASNWASFYAVDSESKRQRYAEMMRLDGRFGTDHATVLNASHEGRLEFRIPRGTLRIDRFYAKLEWVASMIEFTRDPESVPAPVAYMAWVAQHKDEWPEIAAFLKERFYNARYEDADTAPAPAEASVFMRAAAAL